MQQEAKTCARNCKNKRVEQSECSLQAYPTNVNRIANILMEKLGQCNEMFAKLQEMTNKHVEKYTGLFPEYRNLKPREKGNKISKSMCKQRRKNTRSTRNKAHLTKKHIKNH